MLVLREMYQPKSLEDILQNARVSDINFALAFIPMPERHGNSRSDFKELFFSDKVARLQEFLLCH